MLQAAADAQRRTIGSFMTNGEEQQLHRCNCIGSSNLPEADQLLAD